MTVTVAVDPGKSGAIALIDSSAALIDVYDMPTVGKLVSARLIVDLEDWEDTTFGDVIIEDVHAMPGQGVTSMFSFGRSLGVVEGVFGMAGKPIHYVTPQRWKKELGGGLGPDKEVSRLRAINLWPAHADKFSLKKHADRAEAALIGYWHVTRGAGA
jgi:crossover junction endodeoxyribonuclease RuvC